MQPSKTMQIGLGLGLGLGLGIKGFTKDFEKRCRDKKTGKTNKQTPHIIQKSLEKQ
jgi:hypothetical protein